MISIWWLTLFYSYSNINKITSAEGLLCKCLVCTITHTYRRTPYLHQALCTKCICFYHYHNFHSDITLWNPLFIVNHCKCNLFIIYLLTIHEIYWKAMCSKWPLVENAILKLLPEMDFIPMPYVKVKKYLKLFFCVNSSKKPTKELS